ncbi:peptide chain release factor 1 [Elusimicrobiota bacterium]
MDRLERIEREYGEIEAKLASGSLAPDELKTLTCRHSELTSVVRLVRELRDVERQFEEAEAMLAGPDEEMRELASAERDELRGRKEKLDDRLRRALLPKDPDAGRDVYVEVRAGAGGEEAALFAAELVRMYTRFSEGRGWKVSLVEFSRTGLKGAKQAIIHVRGEQVYSWFKFEGGVHRVQRVPLTESSGRIHTSTVTVAVMPEVEEKEVEINSKDLRIDTFRAGGAGGQNVNKVETAIRITHVPSGVVVACQEERSQGQNRARAMSILGAKLARAEKERAERTQCADRRRQVGTGDRSEKIRTYNFPQDRVTEHRLERSWHDLPRILEGEISAVLESLRQEEERRLLRGEIDP